MIEKAMTQCAYCGEELELNQALFASGCTGEPACPKCFNENELNEPGGEDI